MFGFGKKTIAISEYGLWVLKYSDDFVSADAQRSLGSRFPDYDASRGWVPVFEKNGVPISLVKLYLRVYTHCVLQTVFNGYSSLHRRTMVQGAISGIADTPTGYDFSKTFDELEAAFEGRYKFDSKVEPLNNPDARLPFMHSPNVGIQASKFLINSFIIPNMTNRQAFIDDFKGYSMAFGSAVATAHRASEQILSKVKLAP
jgi:hypothetical protein